jgi:ribosomal protein L13
MLKASHHTSTLSASTFKKPSQSRKTARNLKKRIEGMIQSQGFA